MCLAVAALAVEPRSFDPGEIRAATAKLIDALQDPDPTAWVYMYTEDAGLLEAGAKPLEGRAKESRAAQATAPDCPTEDRLISPAVFFRGTRENHNGHRKGL